MAEVFASIVKEGAEPLVVDGVIASQPPSGKYKVTNLYVDPVTGKLVVEYDDTPTP